MVVYFVSTISYKFLKVLIFIFKIRFINRKQELFSCLVFVQQFFLLLLFRFLPCILFSFVFYYKLFFKCELYFMSEVEIKIIKFFYVATIIITKCKMYYYDLICITTVIIVHYFHEIFLSDSNSELQMVLVEINFFLLKFVLYCNFLVYYFFEDLYKL